MTTTWLTIALALTACVMASAGAAQENDSSAEAMRQLNAMGYKITERGLVNRKGQVVDPASVGTRSGDAAYVAPTAPERVSPGSYGHTFEYGDAADGGGNAGAGRQPVTTLSGGSPAAAETGTEGSGATRSPVIGPSVEMITGGGSANGTARVGRLPILD